MNLTLAAVSPAWVHPLLIGDVPTLTIASEQADAEGPTTARRVREWATWCDKRVQKWAPGVYSVPYLSPGLCDLLGAHLDHLGYCPNEDEDPEARINECVLNHMDPTLFTLLNGYFYAVAKPLANLLLQLDVNSALCIQGAVYETDGTPGTAWHKDTDSEFTVTVALTDPAEFDGGGTSIWRDGFEFDVPPLPKGHALLFAGRTTLHKGNTVHSGRRQLLVHWCNQSLDTSNLH